MSSYGLHQNGGEPLSVTDISPKNGFKTDETEEEAGSEGGSSRTTEDSGNSTLAEVHSSGSLHHSRNPSNLSTASNSSSALSSSFISTASQSDRIEPFVGFVIAFHRKMVRLLEGVGSDWTIKSLA